MKWRASNNSRSDDINKKQLLDTRTLRNAKMLHFFFIVRVRETVISHVNKKFEERQFSQHNALFQLTIKGVESG